MESRARTIVKLAAARTETPFLQSWLEQDSTGCWETDALALLYESADKAIELKLTEEQVNEEIAAVLVLRGLKALLVEAHKNKRGR
jgi:hypothetical protein